MALEVVKSIDVDFYDKKYILINAKQLDNKSRQLLVTCYNQGEIMPINNGEHAAYVRYKKSDDYCVFNPCMIKGVGKVLVEFTEQMLASDGICYADLLIVNKGDAEIDSKTCEIVTIKNAPILSSMTFCIDVTGTAVENSQIESSYEFIAFNQSLERYWADFEDVMKTSKSWAVGNTDIRNGENTDNSKYYSQMSKSWAVGSTGVRSGENSNNSKYYANQSSNYSQQSFDSANLSQSYAVGSTGTRENEDVDNASYYSQMSKSYTVGGTGIEARSGEDTDNAEYYSRLAKSYAVGSFDGNTETRNDENTENAKTYMETAKVYMETTEDYKDEVDGYKNTVNNYMTTTESYMKTTDDYMKTVEGYMEITKGYMDNASDSETNAQTYMNAANVSEVNALNSAAKAQSYAVGGTGTRNDEDTDNAYYYYEMTKTVVEGLQGGYMPMGTISFSELATVEKAIGYVYNMREDFVTDESFREGSGKFYTAGTNVYYTANEEWDCLGGAVSPIATVAEVKDYLGINEEIEIG